MIPCVTVEHLFRAFRCAPACLVDGLPATINTPENLPSRKSKKPFAALYWVASGAHSKPKVMRADLRATEIQQIERTAKGTIVLKFFEYSPLEIQFLGRADIDYFSPTIRCAGTWREISVGKKRARVEDYRISPDYSVN